MRSTTEQEHLWKTATQMLNLAEAVEKLQAAADEAADKLFGQFIDSVEAAEAMDPSAVPEGLGAFSFVVTLPEPPGPCDPGQCRAPNGTTWRDVVTAYEEEIDGLKRALANKASDADVFYRKWKVEESRRELASEDAEEQRERANALDAMLARANKALLDTQRGCQ